MKIMKAYIWDLDGTLLDSYGSIVSSLESVSRECGIRDSREDILKAVKQESVSAYLRSLSERTGKSSAFLYERYRDTSHLKIEEIGLIPGAVDTLARGILSILTGAGRQAAFWTGSDWLPSLRRSSRPNTDFSQSLPATACGIWWTDTAWTKRKPPTSGTGRWM